MLIKVTLPFTNSKNAVHPCLWNYLNEPNVKKVWLIASYIILEYDNHWRIISSFSRDSGETPDHHPELEKKSKKIIKKRCPILTEEIGPSSLVLFRSIDVFQQNDSIAKKQVYAFVKQQLEPATTIHGIGGEFYLYFLLKLSDYKYFHGISNHDRIIEIAEYNLSKYLTKEQYRLECVDYDKNIPLEETMDNQLLINLSSIPLKIFEFIKKSKYRRILIITCDLNKYNKRRYLLEGMYKLSNFAHIEAGSGSIISIYSYLRINLKLVLSRTI